MNRAELGRSLNLREEMIGRGRGNRPGTPIRPSSITVHNTSNPGPRADAAAHSRFVRETGFYVLRSGKRNWVSWHYSVDDKQVIKHLPVSERALHAGRGNGVSIAIEVCMHREIDQSAADARAARLVAALLFDLRIGRDAIRTHQFWTGKACPILLLPRFTAFVTSVQDIIDSLQAAPAGDEDELITSEEHEALARPLPPEDPDEPLLDEPDIDHDELNYAMSQQAGS
jgi:N-acetylmuramoyl-L-alanine amidase CwlA